MTTYILIDCLSIARRTYESNKKSIPVDDRIGLSINNLLLTAYNLYYTFEDSQLVFCGDGWSWRKEIWPKYKANRKKQTQKKSVEEQKNDKLFIESINQFIQFIKNDTNAIGLQETGCEGDDLIALWIEFHKNSENARYCIVSSDSDFHQLIDNRTFMYDTKKNIIIAHDGTYDKQLSKKISDDIVDGKYELFKKCIRGDSSDGIFSAYPNVREKGTKNKTGILEAYADKDKRGFDWNNFMNQTWTDINGETRTVKNEYAFNKTLIDLRSIPNEVKIIATQVMKNECQKNKRMNIGVRFMKFCKQWELVRLGNNAAQYANMLNKPYRGVLKNET